MANQNNKKNKKEEPFVVKKESKFFYSVLLFGLVGMLFYGALVLYDTYSRENNLQIQTSTTKDIKQGDSILIKFSTAVDGRYNLNKISVTPSLKVKPLWINSKELRLYIQESPRIGQTYLVNIRGIKTFWFNFRKDLAFKFQSAKIPEVVNVYPVNNQKEVDYNAQIKIDFKEPLSDRLSIEVDINPDIEVEGSLSDDKASIQIIPKKELEKAQKYDIIVSVKDKLDKSFSENLYTGNFITKIPPRIIYSFKSDGTPRATEDLTWSIPAKIVKGKYIDIDLTHQVMSIFKDGLRQGSYKVSSGKRGMETPTGTFKILSKGRRPWSAHYGLYMPWYMGFTTRGHGIHELPEWPSGYKEGANHLGIPVSHGCVRLGVGPAKLIYDFSDKGTPVVVHY